MSRITPLLLLAFTCLLAASVIIEDASVSGTALSESGSLMTFPCYIQNCASCPVSPFICENCSNPLSCCSQFCSNCSGNTCNACEEGFSLTANFCVPENPCAKISVPCTQCSGYNCTGCFSGFYVSTQINQCLPCPDQCTACESQSNCTACQSGFFLNATACSPCSSPCLTCLDSSTTCLSCANGTSLLNSTCVSCGPHCSTCDPTALTNVTCTACLSGFFLNTSNATNPLCSACPILCAVCDNSTSCTTCAYEGLYYNSTLNYCQPCPEYCSVCENSTTCQTCLLNFYISPVIGGSQCVSCLMADCIECVSSTQCKICALGFTPTAGLCVSCQILINGCQNCSIQAATQQQTCTICQINYFLANNTCLPCPAFCGNCTNQTFCNFCWFGYMTNMATGQCTPGYPMCLYNPGATQCQGCAPGYFFQQYFCYPCTTANCLFCNADPLSTSLISNCTQCNQGYYLNNGSCNPCNGNLNCLTCTGNSTCASCDTGNYLNGNGQCQQCPFGCYECFLFPGTDLIECTQCAPFQYLGYVAGFTQQTCIACKISNCLYCQPVVNTNGTITTQCLTCIPGATLTGNLCIGCNQNCKLCELGTQCLQCFSGFGLVNTTCAACPIGCSSCDGNTSICSFCNIGYYLNVITNLCVPCTSINANCTQCFMDATNTSLCTNCQNGYILNNNTCNPCSSGCLNCGSNTTCNRCFSGFFLNTSRLCTACSGQCKTCTTQLLCTSCVTGDYLDPQLGYCQTCPAPCASCQSNSNCINCAQNYYLTLDLNIGTCNACPSPCATCQDLNGCTACPNNYYLNNQNLCSTCGSNCVTCLDNTMCLACSNGYELDSDYDCQSMSSGFPWWGILLIVIGGLILIGAIVLAVRHCKGSGQASGSYMELSSDQGGKGK